MTRRRVTLGSAIVLVGLVAGFFVAYQISVTRGLAEIDDVAYVNTFQAINRTIVNVWFGFVFFGAPVAIAATRIVWWRADRATRMLTAAAMVLYLVGLAVTGAGNVPLNDALAEYADPSPTIAAQARDDFETDWNRYNLIRTAVFCAAFGCLVVTSLREKQPT